MTDDVQNIDAAIVLERAAEAILELMAVNTELLNSHLGKPLYKQSHAAVMDCTRTARVIRAAQPSQ